MAEDGDYIRRLSRERLLAGEPVEDIAEKDETCTERVSHEGPEDASQNSLLERCCVTYGNSHCPCCPFILVIPCVLIALGLYAMINQTYSEYGSVALVVGVVTLFMGIYLWRCRARITSRDEPAAYILGFPYNVQTLTTADIGSRSGPVSGTDAGNDSQSPAHLTDPDVPSPSGSQPPVLPASGEHSCPHLESDEKTSGSKSQHSERQTAVQGPVSRESSATRTLSEVASSITQIAAESASESENVTT